MIKVYIAGPYSADNTIGTLKNIGKGERLAGKVLRAGFAPHCPWHDKDHIIQTPDYDYSVLMLQEVSLAWLLVSDCVLLLPGWEKSRGTLREIEIAEAKGIPVYYSLEELIAWESDWPEAPDAE
jgi:hypothetical protein